MSLKIINYTCLFVAFCAFTLNLTANSSDRWWVSNRPNHEFENIGLWQMCFNRYRHRFDFYGKIYQGCWWILSPELYKLFSWLSTPWFRCVQAFATLSMIFSLFSLIAVAILSFSKELAKVSSRYILGTAFLNAISGIFMLISVIIFGLRGKDRGWMPRWQDNWYGWSFIVAIVACVLQNLVASVLLFEGANMKLVKVYMEKMYIKKKRLFPPAPK